MKLWLVTIKSPGEYHEAYVVANGASEAYSIYRCFLNEKDLCFDHERCLDSVKLLAEEGLYPECKKRLFL